MVDFLEIDFYYKTAARMPESRGGLWLRFGAHVFSRPLFLSSEMGLEKTTPKSLHVYSKKCVRVSKITGKRLEYSKKRAPKGIFELLAAVL